MHAKEWTLIIIWMVITWAVFAVTLATEAEASRQNPGSCILFPYFDTSGQTMSIHTITNVGDEDVAVRLVFIPEGECSPIGHSFLLQAKDTFTFGAHGILALKRTGFLYAYVLESFDVTHEKDADVLVGQEIVLGSWDHRLVNFSLNAASFQAIDVIKDGKLHLDGKEFTAAPKELHFPRFFGQDAALYSNMILINLTGGKYFNVSVYCIIYNDNGVPFSDQIEFGCFQIMRLQDLSPWTMKNILLTTNHDPLEPWPFYSLAETGWLTLMGLEAENLGGSVTIEHPSIYAVLVEGFGSLGFSSADLPLQTEDPSVYNHAMLWSTSSNGN